jgi:putative ABC transport system permease protein
MDLKMPEIKEKIAPKKSNRMSKSRPFANTLWEAFKIAIDSIWNHKMRSILTLLGVIIGIVSVVTVGGAIGGLGDFISNSISSTLGSNTFIVDRFIGMNISAEEREKRIKRNKDLNREDLFSIQEKCENCNAITPMLRSRDDAKRNSRTFFEASITGANDDLIKIQSLKLAEGRFFSSFDVFHTRPFAIIGSQIRNELFGTAEAIGKEIKIGSDNFLVIGVEEENGKMMGQSLDANIYIPYTAFLKKYGLHRSIQFRVQAPSEQLVDFSQDEVRQILRARHRLKPKMEDDFDILGSKTVQETVAKITGIIETAAGAITFISLLVGGIVVMNIMLVTVTERTVEIGTRKAVGAKRSDILLQFLIESGLLASFGGALGILVSYMICLILGQVTPFPMHISVGYIILAMVASGGVGLISGIYPAYKAAKLNPIVALTKEG